MNDEELVKRLQSRIVTHVDADIWMLEAADRIEALAAENAALREALGAAIGYLLNAKIDLETGARKSTAIATIDGGLRRARAALQETRP